MVDGTATPGTTGTPAAPASSGNLVADVGAALAAAAGVPAAAPPAAPPVDPTAAPPPAAAAPPADPAAATPPVIDPAAPAPPSWEAFKEARVRGTVLKQERDALRTELETVKGNLTAAEQKAADHAALLGRFETSESDRNLLIDAINSLDPEVVRQIREAMPRVEGRRRPATPAQPNAAPTSGIPAEDLANLRRLVGVVDSAAKVDERERAEARERDFNSRLETSAAQQLTARGYDPSKVLNPATGAKTVDYVLKYVVQRAAEIDAAAGVRGACTIDDLPHLIAEWHAMQRALSVPQQAAYVANKIEDARTVPPSAPGGPPVVATPPTLGIRDPNFLRRVTAMFENGVNRVPT